MREAQGKNEMKTLKEIIRKYIGYVSLIFVAIILVVIGRIEILNEQKRACDDSLQAFHQIEQKLEQNQKELEEIRQEYTQTCLHNAEAIAYMLQDNPDVMNNRQELEKIAEFMEVDEIHIFDTSGCIVLGTCPEYYGYTFDSGEQMCFFKPMLEDKSLKLVQEITPNTAESKMMQYSAVWSKNGEFILQVGMEPVRVMKAMEKNELSYIFFYLRVDPAANYYAVDQESGNIVGTTDLPSVGKKLEDIGLSIADIPSENTGFHCHINGTGSFCVFRKIGTIYVGRVIPDSVIYQRLPANMILLVLGLLLIVIILSSAMMWCMNRYVINGIYSVNKKLYRIAKGNLDEVVDVQSCVEFSELSSYINEMVKSLLANSEKMSYVLGKTNMYIGVYEYNKNMKKVRFTEYIPRIFLLNEEESKRLSEDDKEFQKFIEKVRENPVAGEQGTYKLGEEDHYVKLEEISEENGIFGVAIDVTEEITRRKKIEVERDIDSLTGLYNRRGLDVQLSRLFGEPEKLGYCAMVMVDADGLKIINDTYGHEKGDVYLKKIGEMINTFETGKSVAARQGGDEFVLFLYQYEREEDLFEAFKVLDFIRQHCLAYLGEQLRVPLSFSFGYSLAKGELGYQEMLKEADERMYENKRERKAQKKHS